MACNSSTLTSTSAYTVIIPAGCLGETVIELQCKSPQESVYYQFSLQNRLQPSEMITSVVAEASDGSNVVVDNITTSNQYFKCRVSGGNLNTLAGIRFLITANNNAVREFDVTLPILPAGVIKDGSTGQSYVIGDKGGVGEQGDQGIQGEAGTQIITTTVNPTQKDAAKNIMWLNMTSGELFETIPSGEQYTWSKMGNLKGNPGNRIYTGVNAPDVKDSYNSGDLYLNISNNNLYNFAKEQSQWSFISNLKGEQGIRGSLWFYGQYDPEVGKNYQEGDCFLNISSSDVFFFNGTAWQKKCNIQGNQGIQGIKGDIGPQGASGATGKRGSLWITADGKPAVGDYKLGDLYLDRQTYDVYWNNNEEWQCIGNIKGEQGVTGNTGADGKTPTFAVGDVSSGASSSVEMRSTECQVILDFVLQKGERGEKGDSGSRWYAGDTAPNASTGINDQRDPPRPGDMYLFLNADGHDAQSYVKLENGEWSNALGTVAGIEGKPASITVDKVATGEPGTDAIIENVGTSSDVQLDFTIPRGDKGETGADGKAATVTVGDIIQGEAGTLPRVKNTGDDNAAVLEFTIPKGDKGEKGIVISMMVASI